MQEVRKVTIDLLFCAILTFLTIHAYNSLNPNDQSSNNLTTTPVEITTNNF